MIYSEAHNRFVGLDGAGLSAYRAFDAGASVEDLRMFNDGHCLASASGDGLETIYALSQGIFPLEDKPVEWPPLDYSGLESPGTANIEIHGIPVLLEYPAGPLERLCADYFRNCPTTDVAARCHLSAKHTKRGWAIYVNGHEFLSLQGEQQLGLGFMHAARSLLYAEGEYDIAFHAAMVAHDDCGIMLCAPRECGKSTLAAYLVAQGFDLLTDEPALLHLDTCSVSSLPLPVSLKQGSWPILWQELPKLAEAPVHVRSDGIMIRLAHPQTERSSVRPRRLTCIVFPEYQPLSTTYVEPLSLFSKLSSLNEGGMLLAKQFSQERFETFLKLLFLTPAYRIRYASLKEAERILHELT